MIERFNVIRWVLIVILLALASFQLKDQLVPLHTRLVSTDDDARNMALAQLIKLTGEKKAAVQAKLINDLENSDPRVRRFALYSLRKLHSADPVSLKAMVARVSDSKEEVREEAKIALLESGQAIPTLSALLSQPSVPNRKIALSLLARLGPEAKSAIPSITDNLSHPDLPLRIEAALALTWIDPPGLAAKPVLIEALQFKSWDLPAFQAADALAKMGPDAKEAVPALTTALVNGKDGFLKGPYQRAEAARALSKIDPRPNDLEALGWDIKQKNIITKYRAAWAIAEMSPPRKAAVSLLVPALSDKNNFVAGRAMVGLVRIGVEHTERLADKAYPAMVELYGRMRNETSIEGFYEQAGPALLKLGPSLAPHIENAKSKRLLSAATAQMLLNQIKNR